MADRKLTARPSPSRPLLPDWVRESDTVYWWVGAVVGDDRREFDAVKWAAVRDGSTVYALLDSPFTLLVVRGA